LKTPFSTRLARWAARTGAFTAREVTQAFPRARLGTVRAYLCWMRNRKYLTARPQRVRRGARCLRLAYRWTGKDPDDFSLPSSGASVSLASCPSCGRPMRRRRSR